MSKTKTVTAHVTSTWIYDQDIEIEVPVEATEQEIKKLLEEEADSQIQNVADFASGVDSLAHEFSDIEEFEDEDEDEEDLEDDEYSLDIEGI